jgi:hypothetical protein
MQEEQPLQVARCTKIIADENPEKNKYVINVKQIAKFVVNLGERVSPTDIEEGMRVGYVLYLEFKDGSMMLTKTQGRPQQIPDPPPSTTQDRPFSHNDDSRRQTRRNVR